MKEIKTKLMMSNENASFKFIIEVKSQRNPGYLHAFFFFFFLYSENNKLQYDSFKKKKNTCKYKHTKGVMLQTYNE